MKDVPVVLVCYKRPWHTEQVLKSLKEYCIQNLYIFSDAPKTEKDIEGVEKTRRLIQSVRWTKPEIICQEVNQGLAKSIVGAANYVFQSHDRLILLEDDCVPRKYYFDFIRRCLSKYEDEEKIFGINGYTVPIPDNLLENHPFDIYFYPRIGSWGWATWKRAWKHYNTDLEKLHNQVIANNIDINQGGPDIHGNVEKLLSGQLKDVWTLNWVLAVYLNKGYYVYPTTSQVRNIGFDGTGVHFGTSSKFDSFCADRPIKRLPKNIVINQALIDNYNSFFGQSEERIKDRTRSITVGFDGERIANAMCGRMVNAKHGERLSTVHINTHDIAGGAAKVAWRLAEAQRNAGHDSKMLVGYKKSDSEHSFLFTAEADPSARAQCRNEGQLFYEFQGSHKLINNPLVHSADILHLHNLHGGYFNPFSISALSHLKPVVWTLQDMQSITGHCAHSFDCQKWQSGCRQCPHLDIEPAIQIDTSMQLLSDKKLIYDHSYLWLVTPSQWLKSKVEKSILQGHPVELIYNGVDTTVFKPRDKKEARKKFGIAENVLVIGAVAHGGALTNQWKGGNYTQAALDALGSKFPDYVFVNIGGNFKTDEPRIVNIPHVDNESELARIYSALDVFMYTPMADTCPLVVIEAMSCSIPIVSFATGGIPELVRNGMDGYVTEYKNVPQIVKAVERLATNPLLRTEFGRNARERATSKFDLQIISTQYEHLYQRVLEESKTRSREVKLFPMTKIPKVVMTKAFEEAEKCKADLLGPEARQFTQSPGCSHTKYDVSIVIATNDRPQLLDQMLTSLKQAMLGISAEVIVIEGDCSDNTRQVLEKHNITNVYNEAECLGLGRHSWPQLYNFGFSKARGKWAMFAGDDIVFGKGCICHAVELLNKQKNGIAGGIFFYKNLNAEPGWDKFGVDFTLGSKLLMNYGLVRLDLFREVAGLDERYRFCCADGDLCYKLYQTGKQFIPVPGFVIHNNVLDVRKEANTYQSDSDIELYLQRWRHFVPVEKLKPMRLLWQEDFAEAFNVPVGLEKINSGIEHFWRGLACFQQALFENAKIEFLQAVRLACDHWQVLWYLAKAAYECGDEEIAQRAANAVAELVPDFAEAKILVARLETNIAVDQLPEGIHYGLDAGS